MAPELVSIQHLRNLRRAKMPEMLVARASRSVRWCAIGILGCCITVQQAFSQNGASIKVTASDTVDYSSAPEGAYTEGYTLTGTFSLNSPWSAIVVAAGSPQGQLFSGTGTVTAVVSFSGADPGLNNVVPGSYTCAAEIQLSFGNWSPVNDLQIGLDPSCPLWNVDYFFLSDSFLIQQVTNSGLTGNPDVGSAGMTFSGSISLTVNNSSGGILAITSPNSLLAATVGQAYGPITFQATGGAGQLTWSSSGSLDGLTFAGGVLQGTPQVEGSFPMIIYVTDASGNTASDNLTLVVKQAATNSGQLTILGNPDVGCIDPNNFSPFTATPFSERFVAQGGTPPYNWDPEPNGTFFGVGFTNCGPGSPTCSVSGTPVGATAPNNNVFFEHLTLTDSAGDSSTVTVSGCFEITAPPSPMQQEQGSDTAHVGQQYSYDFEDLINGGTPPYTCTPGTSDPFSTGLTFGDGTGNASCLLGGIPTTPGIYTFNVAAEDSGNPPQTQTYTLTLNIQPTQSAPLSETPVIAKGGIVDAAAEQPVVTPGGIMSIYGSSLADNVYLPPSTLPHSLGNVQVTVNGQSVPLFYVSPTQINFQAPLNPSVYYPAGTACLQAPVDPATYYPTNCPVAAPANVVVYRNEAPSATATVPVQMSGPSISLYQRAAGIFDPVIVHGATNQLVSPSNALQPGETVVMYGTGIGIPTCYLPTGGTPNAANCLANIVPEITYPDYPNLGNTTNLLFAGLTPDEVGLAQFNLQLPTSLPSAAVSAGALRMRMGDPTTGQTFYLYLQGGGAGPLPPLASLQVSSLYTGFTQTGGTPTIAFTYQVGGATPSATVAVASSNSGTPINYAASASTQSGGAWLSVSPASGTTPGSLAISVDPVNLAAGSYTGSVVVTAPGASNSPVTILVSLTVPEAPVSLQVSSTAVDVTYTVGGAPLSVPITLTSSNPFGPPISYTASATTQSGGTWLFVNPTTGSTPDTLTITISGPSPPPFSPPSVCYNGSVVLTAPSASDNPVTVSVQACTSVSSSPPPL